MDTTRELEQYFEEIISPAKDIVSKRNLIRLYKTSKFFKYVSLTTFINVFEKKYDIDFRYNNYLMNYSINIQIPKRVFL